MKQIWNMKSFFTIVAFVMMINVATSAAEYSICELETDSLSFYAEEYSEKVNQQGQTEVDNEIVEDTLFSDDFLLEEETSETELLEMVMPQDFSEDFEESLNDDSASDVLDNESVELFDGFIIEDNSLNSSLNEQDKCILSEESEDFNLPTDKDVGVFDVEYETEISGNYYRVLTEETEDVESVTNDHADNETVASGSCGDEVFWSLDATGFMRIWGSGPMNSYDLENPQPWYDLKDNINTVNIEEGVTSIGASVFAGTKSLREISFSNNLHVIGKRAFQNSGIRMLILPDNVQSIDDYAFQGCESLKIIELPSELKKTGRGIFSSCTSLEEIILPHGLEEIEIEAFDNCDMLQKVHLPDTIKRIRAGAFRRCKSLKEMIIPASVQTIDAEVFLDCINLKRVMFCGPVPEFTNIETDNSTNNNMAFTGDTISVYYPEDLEWAPNLSQSYGGVLTWGEWQPDISKCNIELEESIFVYDGREKKPEIYVVGGDVSLEEGIDYIVSYANNTNVGNGIIHIEGCGIYSGSQDIGFEIRTKITNLTSLTYNFSNSFSGFSYPSNYRIKLSIYQKMFGVNALADTLYLKHRNWGGNCYGMSTTSGLFNNSRNDLRIIDFNSDAKRVFDLGIRDLNNNIGLTVTDFIECMQVSQYDSNATRLILQNRDKLNQIASLAGQVVNNDEPVLICIYGNEGGHAIIGYDIKQIDEQTALLYVYDCNYPNEKRYITLTGEKNNYTSWYYLLNNKYNWGTGYEGSWISYIPYSFYEQLWMKQSHYLQNMNLIASNTEYMQIKDVEQNVIAEIRNGALITDNTDIYKIYELGLPLEGTNSDKGTLVYIPSDRIYLLENKDMNIDSFEVSITNVDHRAMVTTASDEVAIIVNDIEKINEVSIDAAKGETYQIEMMSTDNDDPYSSIVINGICQDSSHPIEVSIKNGEPIMNMTDGVSLMIDGQVEYDTLTKLSDKTVTKDEKKPEQQKETLTHVHKWTRGKQTKEATVLSTGELTYTCLTCGKKKITKTEKLKPTISLNATSIKLKTKQRTKAVRVGGLSKGDRVASVKSSNKKIVTASYKKGTLIITAGKVQGNAKITITLKSGKATRLTVRVQKKKITTKTITGIKKTLSLHKGQKIKLTPTLKPITSEERIKYSSSNKKIVKVDKKGNLRALKKGKATITVTSGKKKVKCRITVR